MDEPHITVLEEFVFKPESLEEAKQIVLQLIPPSRNDPGCWHYDFFQDHERNNICVMMERWANKATWEAHQQKDYAQKFLADIEPCLAQPIKVRWFYPVD